MALVNKIKRNVAKIARRAGLLASDRHAHVLVAVEMLTPSLARRNNVQVVLDIVQEAGIEYFAIPDENRRFARIGIDSDSWTRFCEELLLFGLQDPSINCEIPDPKTGDGGQYVLLKLKNGAPGEALAASRGIRLFRAQRDPLTKVTLQGEVACQIERWDRDKDGTLTAPVRNPRNAKIDLANQVVVESDINEMTLKTFEVFRKRNIFEIVNPIDVVYMWVDGGDKEWAKKRNQTIANITGQIFEDSVDESRFRDNGELKYSFRSIFMNAPWVRKIYLVTDAQLPSWLDPEHPKIQVVDHKELFSDSASLPTFNSHAIASRLHHIEGISEQYICFNDDVFLGAEVGPRSFFLSNGVAKFFLSQSTLPQLESYELTHEAARKNVVELLEDNYGVTASRAFWHTPVPQLKSLMQDLEASYPDEFANTSRSQIRSSQDFEVNSWMHHNFGYAMGRTLNAKISYGYFDMSDPQLIPRLNELKTARNLATFCLNDSPTVSEEHQNFVRGWLEDYFPYPAPWEKA